MIYKVNVQRDMTYTRQGMRAIDLALKFGNWQRVAEIANELSAIWGTISQEAAERHEGNPQ